MAIRAQEDTIDNRHITSISVWQVPGPRELSFSGLIFFSTHHANFAPVPSGINSPFQFMLHISLPLKLRVSGQKGRKLLWKEEICHPTRETDKSKYHRGRQHNYSYRSPRPEAKTRGNKLLQRGWYPVRYKESQQKILVRLWFIYGGPRHFKKKLPNSHKLLQSTQKSGTGIPRCLILRESLL